jgi:hypothetical protein
MKIPLYPPLEKGEQRSPLNKGGKGEIFPRIIKGIR